MTVELRDYQQTAIIAVREAFRSGRRAPLLVAPCGAGKTVMFAYMTHAHIQRRSNPHVLILVHRAELLEQVVTALREHDITPNILTGGRHLNAESPVTVGSVFTVVRRLDGIRRPTLTIIDEAHHATSETSWGRIAAHWGRCPTLGTTATPCRLDGAGLGDTFDCLVAGPSTRELIAAGYLARPRVFAPALADTGELHKRYGEFVRGESEALFDKPSITGDALSHYQRLAPGRRAVVFCISVEHAYHVAEQFRAAGFPAFSLDGKLDPAARQDRVQAFRSGRVPILTSCDLISEGFDVPGIEVGISLRPTASTGLWLQQMGRCLRTAPGKTEALILDHAGNSLRHGLPTDEREWSLTTTPTEKKAKATAGVKVCPNCWAANAVQRSTCTECGKPFPLKPREIERREGELAELQASDVRRVARMDQGQKRTLEDLIALGKSRGYKNPAFWAKHVMHGRARKGAVA